ncbi:MAG: hypothetical protein ACOCP4_04025 [Candidatus Woesearchaeota archaeon]
MLNEAGAQDKSLWVFNKSSIPDNPTPIVVTLKLMNLSQIWLRFINFVNPYNVICNMSKGGNLFEKTSLNNTLKRIDGYFNLANVKASLLTSASSVFLGIIFGNQNSILIFFKDKGLEGYYPYFSSGIIISTSISAILSLWVIIAFLKFGNKTASYHSCLYFGSIKNMELCAFSRFEAYN